MTLKEVDEALEGVVDACGVGFACGGFCLWVLCLVLHVLCDSFV